MLIFLIDREALREYRIIISIIVSYGLTDLIKLIRVFFQCSGPWGFQPDASPTSGLRTTATTVYKLTTSGLRKAARAK